MTNTAKRRTRGWLGALVICAVFGPALASAQTQSDVPTLKTARLTSEVHIDGVPLLAAAIFLSHRNSLRGRVLLASLLFK
jgi:hypothetical protein